MLMGNTHPTPHRDQLVTDKMLANVPLPLLGFDETTVRTALHQLNTTWEEAPAWLQDWLRARRPTHNGCRWVFCEHAFSKRSLRDGAPVRVDVIKGT